MKHIWQSPYRGSLLTVLVGLVLLLAARELSPDISLAQVRQAGVMKVCHPPNLPPLIEREGRARRPSWPGASPERWAWRPSSTSRQAGGWARTQ